MSARAQDLPNFAKTVQGPTLIGAFLNLILFGTFLVQASFYFSTHKRDHQRFRIFVAALVLLETVNSVFAMYYSYDRLVNNFGNMGAQAVSNWAFGIGPLTNVSKPYWPPPALPRIQPNPIAALQGLIALAVQTFFAWRIQVLTHSTWIVAGIVSLSVISCRECAARPTSLRSFPFAATAIFLVAAILVPSPTVSAAQIFRPVVITWLVASAAADTLISGVLVTYLRRHRTGFPDTDDVVNKLIRLTVQTGAITSIWAIADLAVYLGDPTAHHLIFNLALAKLYSNSLLSSLNARDGWKYTSALGASSSSGGARIEFERPPETIVSLAPSAGRPEAFVDIESHEMRDMSLRKSAHDYDDHGADSPGGDGDGNNDNGPGEGEGRGRGRDGRESREDKDPPRL
ncbi:hypothetical protein HETIRDRAFT_106358 [Heterobasidion irregulare TC 32-1]|uniref:DUF6534 domain-containing protein n=1 Tax=Heterobasidion irregulare (strain TC 32-1) TaxID=747525 RepID=W4JQC5_HETIT|nr:uncharacterized protein HETIRDRAFT_106358 [Heterobasidion irregulare TC 32-1]ETW75679.1 hypothetical protein HETIRDRAFT_106358 [Heterobasidion irregulare TC 32-1]